MNVFILAAGMGTRLKPLTDKMPKALVPVGGRPLVQILLEKLKQEGQQENKKEGKRLSIVINIHHYGQQIVEFVKGRNGFDLPIQFSDESDELLETGGGLKKAARLFEDEAPILIHNVDILSNVNLWEFYQQHLDDEKVAATLIVSQRETKRYLLFDNDNRLVGWTNVESGEVKSPYPELKVETCRKYAFSGIHIVSHSLIEQMKDWGRKFPIMDFYLSVCDKLVIKCDVRKNLQLLDVGKLDSLNQAETMLKNLGL